MEYRQNTPYSEIVGKKANEDRCDAGHYSNDNGEHKNMTEACMGGRSDNVSDLSGKMTPEEKIASVHIDPDKDNYLPELNSSELRAIGKTQNKKVLLKKSSLDYNNFAHPEINVSTINSIVSETIYTPDRIVPNKNPAYEGYVFVKNMRISKKDGKPVYGTVLLDISDSHECFEIVHVHWVREKNLGSLYT